MEPLVLAAAVFGAVCVFLFAIWLQVNLGLSRRAVQRRAGVFDDNFPGTPTPGAIAIEVRRRSAGRKLLLESELERAGLAFTAGEYVMLRAASTAGLAALGALAVASFTSGAPVYIAAAAGIVLGYQLPRRYLERRASQRLQEIEAQLIDALILMTKSLRAGAGLTQALEFAGRETPDPLGQELRRAVGELQLGADIEVVLEAVNARVGSADLEIASTAMVVQRRVGGNLSDVLETVATTIRERRALKSEMRALTSQQRLQGNMSAALPVLVAGFFFIANPDSARYLFTETIGLIALGIGIFFELFGLWLIRRFSVVEA